MFVSEDKSEAVFAHFKVLDEGNSPFLSAKLQGLDPDKKYTIAELDESFYGMN